MGLLDDAIREHLELKRRAGSDPGEIARLEREALGPVTREPAADVPAPDEPPEDVVHAEPEHHHEVAYDEPPIEDATRVLVPADHEVTPPHGDPAADHADAPHHEEHPHADADDAPPHGDPITERYGQPTAEYDVASELVGPAPVPAEPAASPPVPAEEPPPAPPEGEGFTQEDEEAEPEEEDVLEETPEFLQETPDHDRLWFEQKPPRDFDFGG